MPIESRWGSSEIYSPRKKSNVLIVLLSLSLPRSLALALYALHIVDFVKSIHLFSHSFVFVVMPK